ncbi:MAG TPA: hypothetical protein VH062_01380 [Polyangiaceae bacterium]|nr:hypothetical protein [Polyangiaceae bacterium]
MQKRFIEDGGGWTVEEFIRPDGSGSRAYYYREQRAMRFERDTPASRKLAGFTLIEKDIRTIKNWVNALRGLLTIISGTAVQTVTTFMPQDERISVVRALHVAIVTTYGKMFTQADGRRTSLQRSGWISDERHLRMHDSLMHHRHTFAAHSGAGGPEGCKVVVAIDYSRKDRTAPRLFTELHQPATIGLPDLEQIERLVDALHQKVEEKVQKSIAFVHDEAMSMLSEQKLRALRKGATGRLLRRK